MKYFKTFLLEIHDYFLFIILECMLIFYILKLWIGCVRI